MSADGGGIVGIGNMELEAHMISSEICINMYMCLYSMSEVRKSSGNL